MFFSLINQDKACFGCCETNCKVGLVFFSLSDVHNVYIWCLWLDSIGMFSCFYIFETFQQHFAIAKQGTDEHL